MSSFKAHNILLVIVSDQINNKKPGGVQLLENAIYSAAFGSEVSVKITSTPNIHEDLANVESSRVIIFVQKNGRLSADYKMWSEKLLLRGFEIIEENIFALASRYRPIHPNYKMALMSLDGGYRYSYRSFWSGFRKCQSYLLLPNPGLLRKSPPNKSVSRTNAFTFLRIGRPDPIKWSNFEIEFVQRLADQNPDRHFQLRLVGWPGPQDSSLERANFKIDFVPYQQDPSLTYSQADCYLHHSAIGESFGNTVAEASRFGLPVLYAADLYWDQAPILAFSSAKLLWSTPKLLLQNVSYAFEEIQKIAVSGKEAAGPNFYDMNAFLDLILSEENSQPAVRTPRAREILHYLLEVRSSAILRPSFIEVLYGMTIEALRALKNRGKVDE